MASTQSNLTPTIFHLASTLSRRRHLVILNCRSLYPRKALFRRLAVGAGKVGAFSSDEVQPRDSGKVSFKPSICTADELHYVTVSNSDWRLALWRYKPSPEAPPRNHPLLLLSGVGTNAIGYDLSPESSFARYMCGRGFDTWILEVRGAGLSILVSDSKDVESSAMAMSQQLETSVNNVVNGAPFANQQLTSVNNVQRNFGKFELDTELDDVPNGEAETTAWDETILVTEFTETFMRLSERVSGFLSESQSRIMSAKFFDQISKLFEGSLIFERFKDVRERLLRLLEGRQNSGVVAQIRDLSQKLVDILVEGQRSVSPQLFDVQNRLMTTINDFQKQLDFIANYDWGFDQCLEEDIPAVMEYVRERSKPKDGRLFAIGHSMGGMLLYARLSKCSYEGRDPGFVAIVTLGSSLDFSSSNSVLKTLLPLADPAQALNVPAVPLGSLLAAAYPLASRPPYILSWLNDLISAQDMLHPELFKKLVLNNFCTIPAKLVLQLASSLREGGMKDSRGAFYKDHLHKTDVHVLALAGDRDLICPPEAVKETVKAFPKHLATYKVFGEPSGPHYAHYDLVGGRLAVEHLYPSVIDFLTRHDDDHTQSF